MTVSGNLDFEQRLAWMRQHLESEGRLRIADVAEELGVSEMTIRRDLVELEAMGQVRRVRGGAVAIAPSAFADRHRAQARAKARIASKLIQLVPSSGAIGLDASSTLLRLATAIEGGRGLSVVTDGLETFQALQGKPGVTPILTGGQLEERTGSLVGPIACKAATTLLLSRLFVSGAAIDPEHGPSEASIEEAEVKQALASVAADVVVAADSSKLDTRAVARAVTWENVSTLVTELDPDDDRLAAYRTLVNVL